MPMEFTLDPTTGHAGVVKVLQRIFSTSFKSRSWVQNNTWAKWVLPWTLLFKRAGVLHVTIDITSYWSFAKAWQWLKDEQAQIAFDRDLRNFLAELHSWTGGPPSEGLLEALARQPDVPPEEFLKALEQVRLGEAQIVVDLPALWLVDP